MISVNNIPEPFLFNPLKHHLEFIKEFIYQIIDSPEIGMDNLIRDLRHLGTSVMDVYSGKLPIYRICRELEKYLDQHKTLKRKSFSAWAGTDSKSFKIISLSDGSEWTLKYHDHTIRYIHFFPARCSQFGFRVKSNTLKSALLYYILIGKDFITGEDMNKIRPLLGLPPIKDPIETKAILEMIEILRD